MDAGTQSSVLSYDQIRQREETDDISKVVKIQDIEK